MELEWIKNSTENLREVARRASALRSKTELVWSLMGNKMVAGVAIFSLAAIALNGLFYAKVRKVVNNRKLI